MSRFRLSRNTSFIVAIVVILVAGGTVFAIKKYKADKKTDSQIGVSNQAANDKSGSNNELAPPKKSDVKGPIPEDKNPTPPKLDKELPPGTLSVTEIVANSSKYSDQKIKVRGLVIDAGNGRYAVVDQKAGQNNQALSLAVGPNIDIKSHANSSSLSKGPVHFADPVTLTGTLAVGLGSKPALTLKVKSID
ncbi:MAG TPA: hypothetical protein VFW77_04680 [Candidatus Saccharimonadales bacterium]|nr:hypothetical protein [Candidatus Saccharimonadales bacterium]